MVSGQVARRRRLTRWRRFSRFAVAYDGLVSVQSSRRRLASSQDWMSVSDGVPARCAGDSSLRRMISFRKTKRPIIYFRTDDANESIGGRSSLTRRFEVGVAEERGTSVTGNQAGGLMAQ
ncbi:hypothetical protein LXL04_033860 [Taraxacum kok-saghyz]